MDMVISLTSEGCVNAWGSVRTLGTGPAPSRSQVSMVHSRRWPLLLDMGVHRPWKLQKGPGGHKSSPCPPIPPCQDHYLGNKEVVKGTSYQKRLIKEKPFIKSKDCRADAQGTQLLGGCDYQRPVSCLPIAEKHGDSPRTGSSCVCLKTFQATDFIMLPMSQASVGGQYFTLESNRRSCFLLRWWDQQMR